MAGWTGQTIAMRHGHRRRRRRWRHKQLRLTTIAWALAFSVASRRQKPTTRLLPLVISMHCASGCKHLVAARLLSHGNCIVMTHTTFVGCHIPCALASLEACRSHTPCLGQHRASSVWQMGWVLDTPVYHRYCAVDCVSCTLFVRFSSSTKVYRHRGVRRETVATPSAQ